MPAELGVPLERPRRLPRLQERDDLAFVAERQPEVVDLLRERQMVPMPEELAGVG